MLFPGPPARMSTPGPPIKRVVPHCAVQCVVACAAIQGVVASAVDQVVVAVAAVGREGNRTGGQSRGVHGVIPAQGINDQSVVRELGALDLDRRGQARDRDTGHRADDRDPIGAVGAIDNNGIGDAREGEIELREVGAGQVVDGHGVGAAQGVEKQLLDAA